MNPWNTKNIIEIDVNIKIAILEYIKHRKLLNIKNRVQPDDDLKLCLEKMYENYGYKTIAKSLGITYTVCRNLINNWAGIKTRKGYNVILESTKKFRSNRIRGHKNPWYDWTAKNKIKNSRGIQGYYKKLNGDFVWLRSTWEFIYARWLDKNNIKWNYEGKQFLFKNGESYRPDFTIDDGKDTYIVEIKGYFKNRVYKIDMLKSEYPTEKIIILDNINSYTDNYNRDLRLWKQEILKNQKLKELQLSQMKMFTT